jgi:hypothetical protein
MKSDFLMAITQLAAEKNLPKEMVLEAVESALASAYKRDNLAAANVVVRIDRETGMVHVFDRRRGEVGDPRPNDGRARSTARTQSLARPSTSNAANRRQTHCGTDR